MADVFTPAHKVLVDCLTFAACQVLYDAPRFETVRTLLTDALPQTHATGQPDLDRMILAAVAFRAALDARKSGSPDWHLTYADAMYRVHQAVAGFAWWRLTQSATAMAAEAVIEPPTKELAQ